MYKKERTYEVIEKLKKAGRTLICMMGAVAILAAAIPAVPVHADAIYPGVYSVTVVPTYQNPDTGLIDDVGQNPGIGNMMVQAQVQPTGYVEIEEDGTIWLNTRWNLADSNIYAQFETSSDGSQTWVPRSFEVTNQVQVGNYEFAGNSFDAAVTDFRLQLDTLNDTIRCTNYVDAMARECIWFCYLTDIREGVGDDWNVVQPPDMANYTESLSQIESEDSSVPEESMEEAAPAAEPATTAPVAPADAKKPEAPADKKTPEIKERNVAEAKTVESKDNISTGESPDDSTGIVGLETEAKEEKAESAPSSTLKMVLCVVLGILVGAGVLGAVLYGKGRKKKQQSDLFADVDDSETKEK